MNEHTRIRLDPGLDDNVLLAEDEQHRLSRTRSRQELGRSRVVQNLLIIVTIVSLLVAMLAMFFWMRAEKRFAQNVRVAFVKMAPNGATQVEYYEDGADANRWYQATINKSLIDYVEHRYQRRHGTITYDWGFAIQFMSDQLQKAFVNEFNAAKVAAAFEAGKSNPETEAVVRAIDHDEMITPNGPKDDEGRHIINSTVYLRQSTIGPDGRPTLTENKILRLVWTFRPKPELNQAMLRANPLGISILQERLTDDPTPVAAAAAAPTAAALPAPAGVAVAR